jgi:chorismate mutase
MIRAVFFSALVLGLVRPVGGVELADDLAALRVLLVERLVIMEEVAAVKWIEGRSIDDEPREAKVLADAIAQAGLHGLDRAFTTRVMTAQMRAAKTVQRSLFQDWREAGGDKPNGTPNLEASLRPKISRVSTELIAVLVTVREDLDSCLAQAILDPVPEDLADVPEAWLVAVEGVLGARRFCP